MMRKFRDIDFAKAKTFRKYLGKASLKLVERDIAREELAQQLKKIKRIASKDLEHDLIALESKISIAIAKEKNIIKHIKEEDVFHAQLREKIHALDLKLEKFLNSSELRTQRIKEIEGRVKQHFKTKKQKIKDLNENLKTLENLQKEIKKSENSSKRLIMVSDRIKELKDRLKKLD